MKKFFSSFLFSTALIALVFSCQKSDRTKVTLNKQDAEIISQFSQIGKLHNEGLDNILNDLKAEYGTYYTGTTSAVSHAKVYALINKGNVNFLETTLMPKGIDVAQMIAANSKYDYLIKSNFGKGLVTQMRAKLLAIRHTESESTTVRSVISDMSANFYDAVNALEKLVDKDATKQAYDDLLEAKIATLTNNDEKMKFASAVSVAYNTMQYWKENFPKWAAFFNKSNLEFRSKTTSRSVEADDKGKTMTEIGKDVGKADISGIITGGVGGAIAGGVTGTVVLPAVGTTTGAVAGGVIGAVGGGLGNSAKAAVDAFVDWLVN